MSNSTSKAASQDTQKPESTESSNDSSSQDAESDVAKKCEQSTAEVEKKQNELLKASASLKNNQRNLSRLNNSLTKSLNHIDDANLTDELRKLRDLNKIPAPPVKAKSKKKSKGRVAINRKINSRIRANNNADTCSKCGGKLIDFCELRENLISSVNKSQELLKVTENIHDVKICNHCGQVDIAISDRQNVPVVPNREITCEACIQIADGAYKGFPLNKITEAFFSVSAVAAARGDIAKQAVIDEAEALAKELLDIPEGYKVLFLGGGASLEFCMVPYNFLNKKAAYLNTGVWAKKAMKEAKLFGEVVEVASSADANYTFIPKGWTVPEDVDYFHFTTNNTIYGTEIRKDFDLKVPVIADMSSDIFSRPIDVSKYTCIYGGAQKNLSMAGVTIVIVKEDALGKVERQIPTMLDYRTHVDKGSMFNTPPVVPIYTAMENMRWIKAMGGVKAMEKLAHQRAEIVYNEIDRNKLFRGTVEAEDRSLMNICFVLNDEYKELEKDFFDFATSKGMVGIKGHRSVGGFRASCYNAQTVEGCEALVACMKEYEALH